MRNSKIISLFALTILLSVLIQATAVSMAQVPDINDKIREEGMKNSQIMKTLHFLTDVYGPRLTGSPNHVAAATRAAQQK